MSIISRDSQKMSGWVAVSAAVMGLSLSAGAASASYLDEAVGTADFSAAQGFGLGDIRGQSGGGGQWRPGSTWFSGDDGGSAEVVDVSSNPLVYNVSGGGTVHGGDRALELTGPRGGHLTGHYTSRRLFDSNEDGMTGDIYMSYLYRPTEMSFDEDSETYDAPWAYWTLQTNARLGHSSSGEFLNRVASGGAFGNTGRFVEPEETYLIVGRLRKTDPTGNYDRFDMWLNPAYGDSSNPLATATHPDGTHDMVSLIGLGFYDAGEDYTALMGELRVGESWDSVVPVPEPSSLALLGLSGLLMLRRRGSTV